MELLLLSSIYTDSAIVAILSGIFAVLSTILVFVWKFAAVTTRHVIALEDNTRKTIELSDKFTVLSGKFTVLSGRIERLENRIGE